MNSSSNNTSPAHELLPDDVARSLPQIGQTSEDPDPIFHLKWFMPDGGFTWYVAEYDPEARIAFGCVVGLHPEWGSFSMDEILHIRGALGLSVERDRHFDP